MVFAGRDLRIRSILAIISAFVSDTIKSPRHIMHRMPFLYYMLCGALGNYKISDVCLGARVT